MKFLVQGGSHSTGERTYQTGEIIETNSPLDLRFGSKFLRLPEAVEPEQKPEPFIPLPEATPPPAVPLPPKPKVEQVRLKMLDTKAPLPSGPAAKSHPQKSQKQ